MKRISWMALLIFLVGAQAVHAHHLWVFEEDGQYVVARGHLPDRLDDYDPKCVSDVKGFDETGRPVVLNRKDEAARAVVVPDQPVSIITVTCDWGFRANTTQGKKLIPRKAALEKGLKVISAFFSTQFLKSLPAADFEGNTKPLGLKMEMTPLKNISELSSGDLLPVKVTFDGTPLPDTTVVSSDKSIEPVKTDENGIAMIQMPEQGKGLLVATHKVPVENDPDMDYRKFMTFLMIRGE